MMVAVVLVMMVVVVLISSMLRYCVVRCRCLRIGVENLGVAYAFLFEAEAISSPLLSQFYLLLLYSSCRRLGR